jgi:hypothetical protein
VETLPASTQVDFAQLVDVSEILTASQVPPGKYVGVSLTLDYADSLIVVDNGNGGLTVSNDNILNSVTDTPLVGANSQLTLSLQLPVASPLVVNSGSVSHLALDFNLAASNTVDPEMPGATTPAGDVKVRVNPVVLAANIVPDPTRQLRLRGTLVSVTNMPPAMSYTVHVSPFSLRDDAAHGDAVVNTTQTTVFSVNGITRTGTDGLAALAALPMGSLTLAQGSFDSNTRTYTATSVIAGTSLPTSGSDFVLGTVVARNGNVLTVSGALSCTDYNGHNQVHTLPGNGKGLGHQKGNGNGHGNSNGNGHRKYDGSDDDGWRFEFNRQVLVTVGNDTRVTRSGSLLSATSQDISVGQRIAAYGKLGTDVSGGRTLDATQGGGRLLVTSLWGNFVSKSVDVVTLGLMQLDGRSRAAYNFAGTGTTAANDATAAAYTVALPLPLNAAQPKIGTPAPGAPLRFFGFVAPFGSAPPAFNCTTLVSYASTEAQVALDWKLPGITAPFTHIDAARLEVSMATLQTAEEAELKLGPQSVDLSKSASGITFVPDSMATYTSFAIAHQKSGSVSTYASFDALVVALKAGLNGTTALYRLHAAGPYDPGTSTLSANRLYVVLND